MASFPNDGKGTGGFSGDRAKRVPGRSSRGGSAAGDEQKWGDEGGSAYWRVSGSTRRTYVWNMGENRGGGNGAELGLEYFA